MPGCSAEIQVGGRIRRVREFELVEEKLQPLLERMRQEGIERGEVLRESPIFPGMPDDAGFFTTETAFSGNIWPV